MSKTVHRSMVNYRPKPLGFILCFDKYWSKFVFSQITKQHWKPSTSRI